MEVLIGRILDHAVLCQPHIQSFACLTVRLVSELAVLTDLGVVSDLVRIPSVVSIIASTIIASNKYCHFFCAKLVRHFARIKHLHVLAIVYFVSFDLFLAAHCIPPNQCHLTLKV